MGRTSRRNKIKHVRKDLGSKNANYIVSEVNKKIIHDEVTRILESTEKILADVFSEVMRNNRISAERSNKMIDEIFDLTNKKVNSLI